MKPNTLSLWLAFFASFHCIGTSTYAQKEKEQPDHRNFWRYAAEHGSGYFKKLGDGKWEEIGRDGSKMGIWEELNRTPEYVELFDAKRNYKTRLGAGKAWLASGRNSTKFGPSPHGNWEKELEKPPEAVRLDKPQDNTKAEKMNPPQNDLAAEFMWNSKKFTGKEITAELRYGSRNAYATAGYPSLHTLIERGKKYQTGTVISIPFHGVSTKGIKIDLEIGIPRNMALPDAKGGEVVWITFECGVTPKKKQCSSQNYFSTQSEVDQEYISPA